MQVEIDDRIIERLQELVPVELTGTDSHFLVDWLIGIALSMVNMSLEKHPELTIGDLYMISCRNQVHNFIVYGRFRSRARSVSRTRRESAISLLAFASPT